MENGPLEKTVIVIRHDFSLYILPYLFLVYDGKARVNAGVYWNHEIKNSKIMIMNPK